MKVIVANKCDVPQNDWLVSREQGEALAKQFNARYFLVSAKTGENLEAMFKYVAEESVKARFLSERARAGGKPNPHR